MLIMAKKSYLSFGTATLLSPVLAAIILLSWSKKLKK